MQTHGGLTSLRVNGIMTSGDARASTANPELMTNGKLSFDSQGWARFSDHEGNEILLDAVTWNQHIIAGREREYGGENPPRNL